MAFVAILQQYNDQWLQIVCARKNVHVENEFLRVPRVLSRQATVWQVFLQEKFDLIGIAFLAKTDTES